MLAELTKKWRIPSVLYEIALGILVGPYVSEPVMVLNPALPEQPVFIKNLYRP